MTAPNHALTGALIGLTLANPVLALPLAFLSHFVCDAIPHYDMDEPDSARRIGSARFIYEYIVLGALLCACIVGVLMFRHPAHWVLAACCGFAAASPDLFWVPRFLRVRRMGTDLPLSNPFLLFHDRIQWKTGPRLIWLEAVWFIGCGLLLWHYL